MYYHAIVILGESTSEESYQNIHFWVNQSKEELLNEVLIPFLKGQVVKSCYYGEVVLLNLNQARYFRVFGTRRRLSDSQIKKFEQNNPVGKECTEQILAEIRFDKAVEHTKSLLEKLMLPPKRQIFVIMKLGDEYLDSAYKGVIRPLGEEFGYRVIRVDDIEDSGLITDQILEHIAESELVLADLTGARPNCYYETGIAHATGRELILTIKYDEEPHFDLYTHRFILWKTENDLRIKLRKRLESIKRRI